MKSDRAHLHECSTEDKMADHVKGIVTETKLSSRHDALAELQMLGVNTEFFDSMSLDALHQLLTGIHAIVQAHSVAKRGRPKTAGEFTPVFSQSDKKIILQLLSSSGRISSLSLARQLGIPLSTIQRRRVRLEENIMEMHYSLKLEKLGWRSATLFISVSSGNADNIGREILETEDMVYWVKRMVGENTIDLVVEVVFRATDKFMALTDRIKSMQGVKNIFWVESVNLIGRKIKCYQRVIESI